MEYSALVRSYYFNSWSCTTVVSQTNPINTFLLVLLGTILIPPSRLRLVLTSVRFSWDSSNKTLCARFHAFHIPHPSHHLLFLFASSLFIGSCVFTRSSDEVGWRRFGYPGRFSFERSSDTNVMGMRRRNRPGVSKRRQPASSTLRVKTR